MPKKADKDVKKKVRITGPRNLQLAAGYKDRFDSKSDWWWYFDLMAFEHMEKYNYSVIHPASVDYAILHNRALGKDNPLMDKLIFLQDERKEQFALRPNFEISFLRAYYLKYKNSFEGKHLPIENWYTIGSVFTNENSAEQRLLSLGVVGNSHPVVDAECAITAYNYLKSIGFKNIRVLINSIGDAQSRAAFKKELSVFLKENKKQLSDDAKNLMSKHPVRALVHEQEQENEILAEAPQSVDWLGDDDKNHFIRVIEYLDELEIPYMLSPQLMPEHGYQEQTIFALEVTAEDDTKYILAQGGRFNGMSELITDKEIPGMAMNINLDLCLTAIRNEKMTVPASRYPQVFLAQLGEEPKKKALALREQLHEAGIKTREHFGHDSLKNQLEEAVEANVKITLILGQKEMMDGTILIRDMEGGIQEEIPQEKIVAEVKKRLG